MKRRISPLVVALVACALPGLGVTVWWVGWLSVGRLISAPPFARVLCSGENVVQNPLTDQIKEKHLEGITSLREYLASDEYAADAAETLRALQTT